MKCHYTKKKLQKLAKPKKETKFKEPFSKMISRDRVEAIKGVRNSPTMNKDFFKIMIKLFFCI